VRWIDRLFRNIFIFFIRFYQRIIPLLIPSSPCRFTPSCSEYSRQAFQKYNLFKAFGLSLWRILRCNPWMPGGEDPLP
jgi:uncharacterized protein